MSFDQAMTESKIETNRCVLRAVRSSDEGLISHHCGDERLARMTATIPHPYPPGAAEAFVKNAMAANGAERVWVMDGTALGGAEVMGVVALEQMDRNQSEISYWVAPGFWNTGLASAVVKAVVDTNPLGSGTMFGSVFQDNPASARVLVNCGFDYIGDAEAFSVARNGPVPTWTYLRRMAR